LLAYTGAMADGRVGVFTVRMPNGEPEWYAPDPFVTRDVRGDAPFLRFSPDGKSLLLWWNAGRGAVEAWLLPIPAQADNPPRRVLEDLPITFGGPEFSWLPDNRHVVVSAGPERRQAGPRELLLADTRSGRFKLLVSGTTAKRMPVMSPSGDAFVYTDLEANFDVVTLDLATGEITSVIDSLRWEHQPAWAAAAPTPTLAYIAAPNNAPEVWLHQDGQLERPLATASDFSGSETTFFETPALSPDGAHVVYRRVEEPSARASRLWISAVAGGRPERLTNEDVWETGGSWSPDGQWFAYFVLDDGVQVLKKVRTTGQATPQTLHAGPRDEPALQWLPTWSPDGQWVLVPDRGALVAADGSTRTFELGTDFPCAFAATEPGLYCLQAPGSDGRLPVVVRDLNGNISRTVVFLTDEWLPRAALLPPNLRLSPTPDGSGLTYSVARTTASLWLMEGLNDISMP
jgi:Tol biopolymer transport system component